MAKCDKATRDARIEEVRRLLLAGAGGAEIEQHAVRSSWGFSQRQVQRYVTAANKKLADGSRIKKKTFVGKQMQQLNHIFSRGLKDGKYDISLKALKGQVKLVELSQAFQDQEEKKVYHLMGRDTSVPLKERISLFLQAERRGDETAQQLIMGTGRIHQLAFYDFQLGIFLLKHYEAQIRLRQLEDFGEILLAQKVIESSQDEEDIAAANLSVAVLSYRFKACELGWKKFLALHDLKPIFFRKRDAEVSIARSLRKWVCDLAPSDEELKAILQEKYQAEVPFWTSNDVCTEYEKDLGRYLVDPKAKQKLPPSIKQPSKTKRDVITKEGLKHDDVR